MHVYYAYDTLVNLNGSIARKCGQLLGRSFDHLVQSLF